MLMLTRKPGQRLLIEPAPDLPPETTVAELFGGRPIHIVVSKIDGRQVCLGIEAPASLTVWREELGTCPQRKAGRQP
ncbi:MAG TPA: carbon storage regulator [Acidiferrobacterales bacterium]